MRIVGRPAELNSGSEADPEKPGAVYASNDQRLLKGGAVEAL
jgi:hypothetical protein